MSTKRRSYEAGHKRKYLVVIDDSEECDRAVYWAARRAGRTKSQIIMLLVIEPGERNQQWLGVADLMKAEQQEAAEKILDKYAARARHVAKIKPDRVIREGDTAEEIAKLGPVGAEMKKLTQDPVYIDSILADGAERAQAIAAETMKAVKDIVGFVRR